MKLAFADREAYYGDPSFVRVPLQHLLSDAYNDERRALIGRLASHELRPGRVPGYEAQVRSEEHTSELQSLMRISYAVFCLKKKKKHLITTKKSHHSNTNQQR